MPVRKAVVAAIAIGLALAATASPALAQSAPGLDKALTTIAGRIFARGSVGDSNGRTAIKIERIEEGSASYE